jgi:hypothetical protein
LVEQLRVQLQRALGAGGGLQIQVRVHLAPAQRRGDGLAHFVVQRLEFVRQPQGGFEIAVIHGAQLAYQCAPGTLALAPGKTSHAADHYFGAIRRD